MDKQILSRDGPGAQSLEEEECGYHITRDKTNLSSSLVSTKCKVLLLIVGILIVIVAGAVVLAAVGTVEALRYNSHHADLMREERAAAINDPHFDSEPGAELVADGPRAEREKRQRQRGAPITSCYSTMGHNESHIAAHISATRDRSEGRAQWTRQMNLQNTDDGWNTKWACANKSDAFVDGGMVFNQTDKKLYVPVCGYYHISSQVYFMYDQITNTPTNQDASNRGSSYQEARYVSHEVKINRNCGFEDDRVVLRAFATLVTVNATEPSSGKATTHISDVAKVCEGGTVHVSIPDYRYNPCCPMGLGENTFMSAFLVAKTTCKEAKSSSLPLTEVAK